MQCGEDWEKRRKWVGLVWVAAWRTFIEQGDAEIEVGEGERREGFDEDVDDYIGVVEVRIELIPKRTLVIGHRSMYDDGGRTV